MKLSLKKIHLDLKVNWKLSRNQTTFKNNFIVCLESEHGEIYSEIAPNIRYGETPEKIEEQFQLWLNAVDLRAINAYSLAAELNKIPLYHSLRFGLESVLLNEFALQEKRSLSDYLDLPRMQQVATSFTMPIIPVGEIKDYLAPISRFKSLKIKVDAETGLEMLKEIHRHTQVKLRVDANEAWKDLNQFMRFHDELKGMNVEFIEQPFASSMQAEYKELKKRTPYVLMADESIEDIGDFKELVSQFHGVNIKLMKTGSLIRAKELLTSARDHQMKSMIGCMIETTVGISYGMLFGGMVDYVDLDGFLLIKDEPYKWIQEKNGNLFHN